MKIKKLAVCFYGQWRSGTHVVPSLSEIFKKISDTVEINIFFSIKNGENNQEEIKEIVQTSFKDVSNSISVNFLTDKEFKYDDKALKTLYGIVDTLIMKQNYETIYGYHDAVIMIRPDVILPQHDFLYHLVNLLESSNNIRVWGNNIDSLIYLGYNPTINGRFEPLSIVPDQIMDQVVVYTGTASDRVSFECMRILKKYSGFFGNPFIHTNKLLSLHSVHTRIAHKLLIRTLKLPALRHNGFDDFEFIAVNKENEIYCINVVDNT